MGPIRIAFWRHSMLCRRRHTPFSAARRHCKQQMVVPMNTGAGMSVWGEMGGGQNRVGRRKTRVGGDKLKLVAVPPAIPYLASCSDLDYQNCWHRSDRPIQAAKAYSWTRWTNFPLPWMQCGLEYGCKCSSWYACHRSIKRWLTTLH